MAITWGAKPASAVLRYRWRPALLDDDTLSSATLSVSSGTATILESAVEDDELAAFISGGTEGTTVSFTGYAISTAGEELYETIYLPIVASTATGPTARDVINFALRKITGLGVDPGADQEADALECLNDMLRQWKAQGLDVGATFPLVAGTELSIPDEHLAAIKHGLRVMCHNFYGADLSPMDLQFADSAYRAALAVTFTPADLAMSRTLANPPYTVADLFR